MKLKPALLTTTCMDLDGIGVWSLNCPPPVNHKAIGFLSNTGLEVITLEYSLWLKKKRNYWLLADMCPQAANDCALFCVWDWTQVL